MLLSVLDQSPIAEGSTPAQALHNTLDLAELADALGYHRYWVAEHHATPALACAAPEILIGAIAPRTERIRVGSGGVMLPHYSPLKVAETFSSLSGLHPERIDLGLGRAPGTDPMTMLALQRDRRQPPRDDFIEQLVELLGAAGGPAAARPSVRAPRAHAAGPAGAPRAVAARLVAAERALGGAAGPALLVRRLHQPAGRARSPPTTAAASWTRSGSARRACRSA